MPVSTPDKLYTHYQPIYEQIDDFCKGDKAVKEKGKRKKYLPSESHWSIEEYDTYVKLAPFTGFTKRTLDTLMGALFRKSPTIELPPALDYFYGDCDNMGNSILQSIKSAASEVIKKGRHGVLVDIHRIESDTDDEGETENPTVAQTKDLKPYLVHYNAEQIISVNIKKQYIVLKEACVESDDEDFFKQETEIQYRVLILVNGVYQQWVFEDDEQDEPPMVITPTKADGSTFDYIPFQFIGAGNNDWKYDDSPLYDICSKNLTHYQLSADIMKSSRLLNGAMMHIDTGQGSADEFQTLNKLTEGGTIHFGSAGAIVTTNGGSAQLIQPQPNTLATSERDKTTEEAIMLGARLISKTRGTVTAEEIRADQSAENSTLSNIADNLDDAYEQLINIALEFLPAGPTAEFNIEMNRDFFALTPDAQILTVMINLVGIGVMTNQQVFDYAKKLGLIAPDVTLDEITDQLSVINPLG